MYVAKGIIKKNPKSKLAISPKLNDKWRIIVFLKAVIQIESDCMYSLQSHNNGPKTELQQLVPIIQLFFIFSFTNLCIYYVKIQNQLNQRINLILTPHTHILEINGSEKKN